MGATGRRWRSMVGHGSRERYYSHPGIVLLPIRDAPATEWALVWRANDLHPRARASVETAAELGPHPYGGSRPGGRG